MWPFNYLKQKKQRQQAFQSRQRELAQRQKIFQEVTSMVHKELQEVIELWENKFQVILWQRGKCQVKAHLNFGEMMAWTVHNVYNQKQHEVLHVSLIGSSHFQVLLVPGRSIMTSDLSESQLRQALGHILSPKEQQQNN